MGDMYLKRAFLIEDIPPEDINLEVPPSSGLDYLYRVRLESRKCPKVVVANIDTTQFLDRQTVQVDIYSGFIAARDGFKPEPEWQEKILKDFRESKAKMAENLVFLKSKFRRQTFPMMKRAEEWCLYCLGAENTKKVYYADCDSESTDAEELRSKAKKRRCTLELQPPLLSVVLHLDQNQIKKLLSYFDIWLNEVTFSNQVGKWIYSLLICLQKPLDPDTCSVLRSLSRHCCRFRDRLTSTDDELVKPLNMIITIIAYHFDQKDLSDNFHATI